MKTEALRNPPALMLIDVQTAFDQACWGPRNNPQAESVIASMLALWRELHWPIVHVRHASLEANSTLRADQPGYAYKPEAQPRTGEVEFIKSVNSAFIGTELHAYLQAQQLQTLVFAGISTDHCVSTTVRMAANLGYRNFLLEDACFSFDKTDRHGRLHTAQALHEAHLASLDGEFCCVSDSQAFREKHLKTWLVSTLS